MYVCMYVCMYIYLYIIFTYICKFKKIKKYAKKINYFVFIINQVKNHGVSKKVVY